VILISLWSPIHLKRLKKESKEGLQVKNPVDHKNPIKIYGDGNNRPYFL
jgi:hypothetical protein